MEWLFLVLCLLLMASVFLLVYETCNDLKYKRYICHKCKVIILVPRDKDHCIAHMCDRISNATRIYK